MQTTIRRAKRLCLLSTIALLPLFATAQQKGVTATEIKVGTLQDLSGPIAGPGKQTSNGMRMRVDDFNASGGAAGRKIKLFIEDSGYDPKKSVLATQKLIENEGIFAMAGVLATAPSEASFPALLESNTLSFFPLTSARSAFEPTNRLKFAFLPTYFEQMRRAVPMLVQEKKPSKVCIIYQDDDFGQEILKGTESALQGIKRELVEKTTYKRGATDFASQVVRMKAAGCDMVVLGTVVRETVGVMKEAKKNQFNPVFIGGPGAYSAAVHQLGGADVEGLYATMSVEQPYLDVGSQELRTFAAKYKVRYGDEPTVFSSYGYSVMDSFIKVVEKVGPKLTTDSFIATLEKMTIPASFLGTDTMTFSATKRLGFETVRMSQIQNGRWVVVLK
ncbi:MAG: ABC transporter substrate-binding protein [Burkholderiales bacterium]